MCLAEDDEIERLKFQIFVFGELASSVQGVKACYGILFDDARGDGLRGFRKIREDNGAFARVHAHESQNVIVLGLDDLQFAA